MNYIAYRNLERKSDSLYINKDIVKTSNQLVTLVKTWLHDRGCNSIELIDKLENVLPLVYHDNLRYTENNYGLFQVIVQLNDTKSKYIITFNYTVIGELTYKELEDENKN